jgi:Na+/proline symporter
MGYTRGMKHTMKVIGVIFITVVALLAIALVFKAIDINQFMELLKKIGITAIIISVLGALFQSFKKPEQL